MGDGVGGPEAGGDVAYRHEQSRQFAAYMLALPRQESRPLRSAFFPNEVSNLLPRIILRESVPDGTYRYRLTGSELNSYFGQEVTGQSFEVGVGDRAAAPMKLAFDRMIAHPCGIRCVMDVTDDVNQVALLENVNFPFSGASPPQQIAHIAVLDRLEILDVAGATRSGKLYELEGIDLGAGVPDFSDISW